MSELFYVFVKGTNPSHLAKFLEDSVSVPFVRSQSVAHELWNACVLGLDIALFDHDFEDDGGIPFTTYPTVLSVGLYPRLSYDNTGHSYLRAACLYLACLIGERMELSTIAVHDLQLVVGRYPDQT